MITDVVVWGSNLLVQAHVAAVSGLGIDIEGLSGLVGIGDRLHLYPKHGGPVLAEVVSFGGGYCRALAYQSFFGGGVGSLVTTTFPANSGSLSIDQSWVGRVIDPLGRPLDGKGLLKAGPRAIAVRRDPPSAASRARLGSRIDLGVASINLFATCRRGQRLGVFAGSGVGKSTLMGMLARNADCDVAVIALVGERGREVREFIEDELTAVGMERAIVVVATSDSSPPMRREAALSAMTIAEYFRDAGKSVFFIMDSITRYCMALREIAISSGEISPIGGYPSSVFSEIPKLLERSGPGQQDYNSTGYITGLFSILVEGDNFNEPIADAIRGILDGHIILDRKIAERGRFPAVDVLRSLSRSVPGCNSSEENDLVSQARRSLAVYADVQDLIRLGAYRIGSDFLVDRSIEVAPKIEKLLIQNKNTQISIRDSFYTLQQIFNNTNI